MLKATKMLSVGAILALPWATPRIAEAQVSCSELQKLTGSDSAAGDSFGWAVDLNETWVVVGAPNHDATYTDDGAVYVYSFSGGTATQTQKLVPSDPVAGGGFGYVVRLSGTQLFVGAFGADNSLSYGTGAVYVFEESMGTWSEVQKIEPPSASSGEEADLFGFSLSVSGTDLVVGSPDARASSTVKGKAYVYEYTTSWGYVATITGTSTPAAARFGASVAIEGDVMVIGAPDTVFGSQTDSGTAGIFERSMGTWTQVSGMVGNWFGLPSAQASAYYGRAVTLVDGEAIVGAYGYDAGGFSRSGALFVIRDAGSWSTAGSLYPYGGRANAELSRSSQSMAVNEKRLLVGARYSFPSVSAPGEAYLWSQQGGCWVESGRFVASDGATDDRFGFGVGLYKNYAVIGAHNDDISANSDQGSAYIFRVMTRARGVCSTDWNADGTVNSTDVSDFINDYLYDTQVLGCP